jgi:hypothetical protein
MQQNFQKKLISKWEKYLIYVRKKLNNNYILMLYFLTTSLIPIPYLTVTRINNTTLNPKIFCPFPTLFKF